MGTFTVQKATADTPLLPVYSAVAIAGDQFATTGKEMVAFQNYGNQTPVATATAQNTCNQGFLHTSTVSVISGAVARLMGPFDRYRFADAGGNVQLTYTLAVLTAPATPGLATNAAGGTILAGVYQAEVSYVNAQGETVASVSASITTTGTTSTITITSPVTAGTNGGIVTGWYAYVTQVGGSTYTRQQIAGLTGGAITGITNVTNPVVTTTSVHGLLVGQTVTIAGVVGATGANGTWTVASVADTLRYQITAAAPGVWTSGGTSTGGPTLISTNLVLTAPPTSTGAAPAVTNTAAALFAAVVSS
ncbi:MAG: hypothetical protein NVS2B16_25560 [Chloroflexota bacterium]